MKTNNYHCISHQGDHVYLQLDESINSDQANTVVIGTMYENEKFVYIRLDIKNFENFLNEGNSLLTKAKENKLERLLNER